MRVGGVDDSIGTTVFIIILGLLLLAVIGALIYLYVFTYKNVAALQNSDLEIKSKIGSLVRDINFTNKQEYLVDVEQQNNINMLNRKLGL